MMLFWSKQMKLRSKGFGCCLDYLDSIPENLWIEIPWWFKVTVSYSHCRKFLAFAGAYGCRIGLETRNRTGMWSAITEKMRNSDLSLFYLIHCMGEGAHPETWHHLWFAQLNISCLCQWLKVLIWSWKSRKNSNVVSNCSGNWEILCSHSGVL